MPSSTSSTSTSTSASGSTSLSTSHSQCLDYTPPGSSSGSSTSEPLSPFTPIGPGCGDGSAISFAAYTDSPTLMSIGMMGSGVGMDVMLDASLGVDMPLLCEGIGDTFGTYEAFGGGMNQSCVKACEDDVEMGSGEGTGSSIDELVLGSEVIQSLSGVAGVDAMAERNTSSFYASIAELTMTAGTNSAATNTTMMTTSGNVNTAPAGDSRPTSSQSAISSSWSCSSPSSSPSAASHSSPAYPGKAPVPPGVSLPNRSPDASTTTSASPTSSQFAGHPGSYYQPQVHTVEVKGQFAIPSPSHLHNPHYHPYFQPQLDSRPPPSESLNFSETGMTLNDADFDFERQHKMREERRLAWCQVDMARLGHTTYSGEGLHFVPMQEPTVLHGGYSVNSSAVTTTYPQQQQQNGVIPLMGNRNRTASCVVQHQRPQQDCSCSSSVPSAGSATVRYSYAAVSGPTAVSSGMVDTAPARVEAKSDVTPSSCATSDVTRAPVPSCPDAQRRPRLNRRMSLSVSTGGGVTSLANIPPSPYPSLPPSRQETPPKVSPIGGLLGRVRQRRSSFLLGVAGGRTSAGAWACGEVKKEGVEARTVEAASSGVESQQLTHPSTVSSPPGNTQEVTGSSSSTVTHVPSQPAPTEAPPTVTSSMPILQEASGSMTIEGRRMSLRKRKREETHYPTSEESEHGASNGAIVPGMKGSPSLETSLQEAESDEGEMLPDNGRRQRRKRSHSGMTVHDLFVDRGASASCSPVASHSSQPPVDSPTQPVAGPEAAGPATEATTDAPIVMKKRGKLPKEVTETLKTWLMAHKSHPYPTEDEKKMLCDKTQLNMSQVSNWMINARRRILVPPKKRITFQETITAKPRPIYETSAIVPSDPPVPSHPATRLPALTMIQSEYSTLSGPPPSPSSYGTHPRRTVFSMLRSAHALSPPPSPPASTTLQRPSGKEHHGRPEPQPRPEYPGRVPPDISSTPLARSRRSHSPQALGSNTQSYSYSTDAGMTMERLAAYGYSPAQASYLASKTSANAVPDATADHRVESNAGEDHDEDHASPPSTESEDSSVTSHH